jgi:hypothetical protein
VQRQVEPQRQVVRRSVFLYILGCISTL